MPKLSIVCDVLMQCTIALVSDAQTEDKVSVTSKSQLPRNIRTRITIPLRHLPS